MAIKFKEFGEPHFSPVENWSIKEGIGATCKFICNWTDRYDVTEYLLVTARQYARAFSSVVLADHATIENYGKIARPSTLRPYPQYGTYNDYNEALITVSYTAQSPLGSGLQPYSEELDGNAEMITLDYNKFSWSNGQPLTPSEAPGMVLRKLDYTITFYRSKTFPIFAFSSLTCVNTEIFSGRSVPFVAMPGTLKYDTLRTTRKADSYNMHYRFSYQPWGWNYYWNGTTGNWDHLILTSTGHQYNSFPEAVLSYALPW